jgi:hypothetical protein
LITSVSTAALPKDYEILNRKSIFARDRVSRVPSTGPALVAAGPVSSSVPVLVGIVRDDLGFVAAFEWPDSGKIVQVHAGEQLPDKAGTVVEITLDYLDFIASPAPAPGQPARRIQVGRNLQGVDALLPSSTAATQPADAAATAAAPGSADGDDLLARMRRRRQQEMNR